MCEPAQSKSISTFHKSHFNYTEIHRYSAADQNEPRTRTHTLREPAQSKCISTFTKATLIIRKFTGTVPQTRMSPEHGHILCASLRSRIETHVNISQERLYTEIYRQNAADQTRGPHFVRAWAVEMHFKMSQEPLYAKNYRKNAAPQLEPRTRTHTLCEPAQSKCKATFHKSHLIRKFTGQRFAPRVSTLIKHRPLHLP